MASKEVLALTAERTASTMQKERNCAISKLTAALDATIKQERNRKDKEQNGNRKERKDEQETEQHETIIGRTHRKINMCLCVHLCLCPCTCPWQSSTSKCSRREHWEENVVSHRKEKEGKNHGKQRRLKKEEQRVYKKL